MPTSTRWLAVVALLITVGAGFYGLTRSDPDHESQPGAVDWAAVLDEYSADGFERPVGDWTLALPADHGAHDGAHAEFWNISANLHDEDGKEVGVQFALQRFGLVPPRAPERKSPWELRALYRAHVILLDGDEGANRGEERFHRDVPGVAGHDEALEEVWLDDWTLRYGEGEAGTGVSVDATVGRSELRLRLRPAKPAVGVNLGGNAAPFRGYSITRMIAEGTVGAGDDRRAVTGLAWLDHLWGDLPLPVGAIALDRLQLQLRDGTDLSMTRMHRRDGRGTPTLTGYLVRADGETEVIAGPSLEMELMRSWRDDASGARFPLEWRILASELQLNVMPLVDDQLSDFVAPLWSGTVTGEGQLNGRPVSGLGTLVVSADAIK